MSCGAPHALSASQRAAFDARWRDALAEGEKLAKFAEALESIAAGVLQNAVRMWIRRHRQRKMEAEAREAAAMASSWSAQGQD